MPTGQQIVEPTLTEQVGTLAPPPKAVEGGRRRRRQSTPFVFAWPSIVLVAVFYVAPVLVGFVLSLTSWSSYSDTYRFIGFENFGSLWSEGTLSASLTVTLVFAVSFTLLANVVALGLALLVEKGSRTNSLFRTALFVPVLVSPLAAGYIFRGLLASDGTVNQIIGTATRSEVRIEWLGSTTWTILIIAAVQAWKSFGIYMLVYIAALNAVPQELVAASRIDGAGTLRMIWAIKIPLIAPAFTFNLALALIGALQTFELVVAMTFGGPGTSTSVLNLLIWRTFGTGAFGYASALSVVLFVVVAVLALPLIRSLRKREVDL